MDESARSLRVRVVSGAGAAPPLQVFSRNAVREVDRLASEEYALPTITLMENAGACLAMLAAEAVAERANADEEPGVLLLCGPGNNGGDGFVAARRLHNAGVPVAIALAASPQSSSGDAAVMLRVAQAMGLPIVEVPPGDVAGALDDFLDDAPPPILVDCLLGTGLTSAVREPIASIVAWINRARRERGCFVLACDIPTGLDADTGAPLLAEGESQADGVSLERRAVVADATITFAGVKRGFLEDSAQPYLGEVVVADIGAPLDLLLRLGEIHEDDADGGA